jgi:iron complex outermembrane receptor protein
VLKGPQGTLYGRNTTGGAINVISKLPTSNLESEVTLGYGDYDSAVVRAMVNVPLMNDTLAIRFAGQWTDNSGFSRELNYGVNLGSSDQWNLRASVLYTPTSQLQFVLRADYADGYGGGKSIQSSMIDATGTVILVAFT